MKRHLTACVAMFFSVGCAALCAADVSLPKVIADGMVLQRGQAVPIWGTAAPHEAVTVKFADQEKKATADDSGKWRIVLDALQPTTSAAEMSIVGANQITLKNVLVGEVWLCSGQSNMEYQMDRQKGMKAPPMGSWDTAAEELATANEPMIHLFKVEKKLSNGDVTTDGWNEAKGAELGKFSAVGYFFGKKLRRELKVPIGLIETSWGGTRIEPWTPESAYRSSPAFAEITSTQPASTRPLQFGSERAGRIYDHMVLPLAGYAIRGALWYQGESNCMLNETTAYTDKMEALITGWRAAWAQGDFPFYYVQIAPFAYSQRKDAVRHSAQTLPEFWEAQSNALHIPHTGMVVVTDLVDNLSDIHPSNKHDIAQRLALLAMKNEYGYPELTASGPAYKSIEVRDGKAYITFDSTGAGLMARGDRSSLTFFTIAGEDGQFKPANAKIEGKTIVIASSPEVERPVAVRFAWTETAQPNLFNREGLPALPFRTDSKTATAATNP